MSKALIVMIVVIACAAWLALSLRLVPPPNANVLIWIRDGDVRVGRGQILPHTKEHISEILRQAGGALTGFIAVTPANRVCFSWRIPPETHQRLRNVLLNE